MKYTEKDLAKSIIEPIDFDEEIISQLKKEGNKDILKSFTKQDRAKIIEMFDNLNLVSTDLQNIVDAEEKIPEMFKIYLKPQNQRPDYRLIKTWLWGENHNTDSDGNSYNPASRDWTYLEMSSRENMDEEITINCAQETPLVLEIKSSKKEFLSRVAYFLAIETDGLLYEDKQLFTNILLDNLLETMGDFNLDNAQKRTDKSIWRKSSLENPYPNIKNK